VHKIDGPALVHRLLASPAEPDYAPAGAVFSYGENSVSAGNKYGEPFYGSTYCPACIAPEKAFLNPYRG